MYIYISECQCVVGLCTLKYRLCMYTHTRMQIILYIYKSRCLTFIYIRASIYTHVRMMYLGEKIATADTYVVRIGYNLEYVCVCVKSN